MRIAIANDLPIAVEALRRTLLNGQPGGAAHQVVWVARDGAEAVQRCAEDRPDLLLMDLIMPGMDGVEATRRIMAQTPCAILLVSAYSGIQTGKIFEAMGAGALDVVAPPGANGSAADFLGKIDTMARYVGGSVRTKNPGIQIHPLNGTSKTTESLVAIGSSAGGPPPWRRF